MEKLTDERDRKITTCFCIPIQMEDWIKAEQKEQDCSKSAVVRRALVAYFKDKSKEN